jgi:hypothetical protein
MLQPSDNGRKHYSVSDQQAGSPHADCEETYPARGPHESAINSIPPATASAPPADLPLISRAQTRLMDVPGLSTSRHHITYGEERFLPPSCLQRKVEIAVPWPIPLPFYVLRLNVEVPFCPMLPEFQKSTA